MKEKRKRIPIKINRRDKPRFTESLKKGYDFPLPKILKKITNPIKNDEEMRTSPPKKTSLRLELEAYVYAWNTVLKEAVKTMDTVILLRNSQPFYRSSFASQCFEKGLITERERSEFISGPATKPISRINWRL